MADRIVLANMDFEAHVGAPRSERSELQPIEVDVEMTPDLRAAGQADDLAQTIDYGDVFELCRGLVEERRVPPAGGDRRGHRGRRPGAAFPTIESCGPRPEARGADRRRPGLRRRGDRALAPSRRSRPSPRRRTASRPWAQSGCVPSPGRRLQLGPAGRVPRVADSTSCRRGGRSASAVPRLVVAQDVVEAAGASIRWPSIAVMMSSSLSPACARPGCRR